MMLTYFYIFVLFCVIQSVVSVDVTITDPQTCTRVCAKYDAEGFFENGICQCRLPSEILNTLGRILDNGIPNDAQVDTVEDARNSADEALIRQLRQLLYTNPYDPRLVASYFENNGPSMNPKSLPIEGRSAPQNSPIPPQNSISFNTNPTINPADCGKDTQSDCLIKKTLCIPKLPSLNSLTAPFFGMTDKNILANKFQKLFQFLPTGMKFPNLFANCHLPDLNLFRTLLYMKNQNRPNLLGNMFCLPCQMGSKNLLFKHTCTNSQPQTEDPPSVTPSDKDIENSKLLMVPLKEVYTLNAQ